jgi:soluble lytic murein transglycosylase-like protein
MAVPRLPLAGGRSDGIVTLPHPLDSGAAARIRRIFALQRGGDFPAAIAETAKLDDDILLGDLLSARYLAPGAQPAPAQLRLWLKTFSDLPDAPAIYQLLASVSPHGTRPGPAPVAATLGTESPAAPLPEEADPASLVFTRNAPLDRDVQSHLDTGGAAGVDSALHLIDTSRHLDPLYAAQLRTEVALHLFVTDNNDERAEQIAGNALKASGGRIGLAGYVAGLAAWRAGHPERALPLFEAASRAGLTAASIRAGAAFWAARAHQRAGDSTGYRPWLSRAAAAPRTFYGLLASRILGRLDGNWDRPWSQPIQPASLGGLPLDDDASDESGNQPGRATLSEIDVDAVAATPAGRRAFALLQVGETARAEATLRRLWPAVQGDMALCRSIQLVADEAGLTALSAQLASILQNRDGQPRDKARFPVPSLSPRRGFTVNPALVYALTRLESNFDPSAVSGAGAHGLMQLMPVTAGFVLGEPDRFTDDASPLHNAGFNLELGQRYLAYLSAQSGVHGDLIRLLASYNAGPAAVARWKSDQDPLLFIESLPNDETRDYLHRAFTYLWVYSRRLGVPSPSLVALAAGRWPSFADEQGVHRVH